MHLAAGGITQLVVALLIVTNDYSWLITDPAASFALVQADCTLPTPQCLHGAKIAHRQLVEKQLDYYWRAVSEETTRLEHDRQAKDAHDQYIAQQLAKADKWDRWETSPPTVIVYNIDNSHHETFMNNPTFIANPAFVSACTPSPEIPGLNIKLLAAKHRPTAESKFTGIDNTLTLEMLKQCIFLVFLLCSIYKIVRSISVFVWSLLARYLHGLSASQAADATPVVTVEISDSAPPTLQTGDTPDDVSSEASYNPSSPSPPASPSPLSPQDPERPLEFSTGTNTELAPILLAVSDSPDVEEWNEFDQQLEDDLVAKFNEDSDSEISESPLESSQGKTTSEILSAEPVTASKADVVDGEERKLLLPKTRRAAPQHATSKPNAFAGLQIGK